MFQRTCAPLRLARPLAASQQGLFHQSLQRGPAVKMSSDWQEGWIEHVGERASFLHHHIVSGGMEQYRGKPWDLISATENFTKQNKIPMLISRHKLELSKSILSQMQPKPKVIIELGAYVGNSAVGWGAILKDLNGADAESLRVYTMEYDPEIAKCAQDLVNLSGLGDIVTVMQGEASGSMQKLVDEGKLKPGELDMVFIDHWEKFYVPDLQVCEKLKLFHEGSLAMADNTEYPGAPTYMKYVKGGGSGAPGSVRYETRTYTVDKEERKSVLEVSKVVEA